MNKKPIPANLSLIRAAAGKKGGSVKSKRKADAARSNLDGNRKGRNIASERNEHKMAKDYIGISAFETHISYDNTKDGDRYFGEVFRSPVSDDSEPVFQTSFCATKEMAQQECREWIITQ